jgi:hypothetical protein
MADQFRDQINTARRAGYTDDELVGYLKDKAPRVTQALDAGYTPTEIMQYLAPALSTGEEVLRKTGVAVRGATEALAPATAGATAGFMMGGPVGAGIGALAGGLAVPAADVLVQGYNKLANDNVRLPSQVISSMIPGPRAETPTERVVQSSAGALTGTAGSVAAGRKIAQLAALPTPAGAVPMVAPGVTAIAQEAARRPIGQIVAAPLATSAGQTVTELTGNPLAGLAAGIATGGAAGMRPTKRGAVPTAEELLAQSKANYDILDKSGFQLDAALFKQHMASLPAKLRSDVGYVESVNPKVAGAFKELLSDAPKDVAEITALRKIIGGAAGSADKTERMAAMKLLDEFDNYVLNAPPSAIISGDAKAMQAWKAARADYAKVKKSELIEDIAARAEVSQSGKEPSIAQGLSALAKNDKKMRFFTPEEQEAIREAAKGGSLQGLLRTIGKFSPMTPAAAIFTAVNPYGAYTAAAGMAAKELATAQRMRQINALSSQMRLGQTPQVLEGPLANQPVFFSRSAQNMLGPVQQNQNNLAPPYFEVRGVGSTGR